MIDIGANEIEDILEQCRVTKTASSPSEKEALDQDGYSVLAGVIDAGWLERLRSVFERTCGKEGKTAGIKESGTRNETNLRRRALRCSFVGRDELRFPRIKVEAPNAYRTPLDTLSVCESIQRSTSIWSISVAQISIEACLKFSLISNSRRKFIPSTPPTLLPSGIVWANTGNWVTL